MTRNQFIERSLRQIYNGYIPQDAEITFGLINVWLQDAIAVAAKTNYTDSLKLDGVGYVNNSFYTTFKNLPIIEDEQFLWKVSLPQIPFGIGHTEGISVFKLKGDKKPNLTLPLIPLTQDQLTFYQNLPPIKDKVLYYYEGSSAYILSPIILSNYTASITMISGGDATDLNSELNVPADYFPVMVEYIKQQLLVPKQMPKDLANDGRDLNG